MASAARPNLPIVERQELATSLVRCEMRLKVVLGGAGTVGALGTLTASGAGRAPSPSSTPAAAPMAAARASAGAPLGLLFPLSLPCAFFQPDFEVVELEILLRW